MHDRVLLIWRLHNWFVTKCNSLNDALMLDIQSSSTEFYRNELFVEIAQFWGPLGSGKVRVMVNWCSVSGEGVLCVYFWRSSVRDSKAVCSFECLVVLMEGYRLYLQLCYFLLWLAMLEFFSLSTSRQLYIFHITLCTLFGFGTYSLNLFFF